jgi:uncharacterized protein (TIRG00374 family)
MNSSESLTEESSIMLRESKTPKYSSLAKTALRISLTAIILGLLIWQVQWEKIRDNISQIDILLLSSVCLLWIPTQWFQYRKWALIAKTSGPDVSLSDIRKGYWVGFTLGLITPGRIGQFGRALVLRNCSIPAALGIGIVERGYSALVVNSLGLLSLAVLPYMEWISPIRIPLIISIILLLLGFGLLLLAFIPRLLLPILKRIADHLPWRDKLRQSLEVIDFISPDRGLILVLLTAGGLLSSLLQFVLIIHAMGTQIPLFEGMLAANLTFFLKGALPFTIGSLGIGEWVAIQCFNGLGVAASVSVTASLLLFFINVFVPSLIGLPFIFALRMPERLKRKLF